jgi:hypothetical protein
MSANADGNSRSVQEDISQEPPRPDDDHLDPLTQFPSKGQRRHTNDN